MADESELCTGWSAEGRRMLEGWARFHLGAHAFLAYVLRLEAALRAEQGLRQAAEAELASRSGAVAGRLTLDGGAAEYRLTPGCDSELQGVQHVVLRV